MYQPWVDGVAHDETLPNSTIDVIDSQFFRKINLWSPCLE